MAFVNFKRLFRFVVLIGCIGVSFHQLTKCFMKIKNPPISTHYEFRISESLRYPSLTVCRDPPYKKSAFPKYGFYGGASLDLSSTWKSFKYDNYSLGEFFNETTYSYEEMFQMAGFDNALTSLKVSSFFTLRHGRCFNLAPKNKSTKWGSTGGYRIVFSATDREEDLRGYHVHIHDFREKFTEKSQDADIFKEYIYVVAGDGIQLNLKINMYSRFPNRYNNCTTDCEYAKSQVYVYTWTDFCVESNLDKMISEEVGCATPWIINDNLPQCNTSERAVRMVACSMPSIWLDNYLKNVTCLSKCHVTTYMPFVQGIRQYKPPISGIKIYLASNVYTAMVEVVGYDWNSFLSDLGGSLGFLLGLSVLGLLAIFEEVIRLLLKLKDRNRDELNVNEEKAAEDAGVYERH